LVGHQDSDPGQRLLYLGSRLRLITWVRARLWAIPIAAAGFLAPAALAGQTVTELVVEARARELDPAQSLEWLERALALDSTWYEANWRAAAAVIELAEAVSIGAREEGKRRRDSLLVRAERYARRAVATDSTGTDGLFVLAFALGREAETRGARDRLRLGDEVHRLALLVLELDPDHDGAHHVLGLWNAEVMRLSGLQRFLARKVLGGKTVREASWAQAILHLERAAAIDSNRITHRLDLARVYFDRKRLDDARRELAAIERLPDHYPGDPRYRIEAEVLSRRIAVKDQR
jgi:tetratricopeptide (TPR) repeat protein